MRQECVQGELEKFGYLSASSAQILQLSGPKLVFRTSLLSTSCLSTSQIVCPKDQAVPPPPPQGQEGGRGRGKTRLRALSSSIMMIFKK